MRQIHFETKSKSSDSSNIEGFVFSLVWSLKLFFDTLKCLGSDFELQEGFSITGSPWRGSTTWAVCNFCSDAMVSKTEVSDTSSWNMRENPCTLVPFSLVMMKGWKRGSLVTSRDSFETQENRTPSGMHNYKQHQNCKSKPRLTWWFLYRGDCGAVESAGRNFLWIVGEHLRGIGTFEGTLNNILFLCTKNQRISDFSITFFKKLRNLKKKKSKFVPR